MQHKHNTPPNDGLPEFGLSQDAQDLVLLDELVTDFGGPQAASSVVALADAIGGAQARVDHHVSWTMGQRQQGNLRPDLMELSDEECEAQARLNGEEIAKRHASAAAPKLLDTLDAVSRQEQGEHVRQILTILGVMQVGDEFGVIPRDEDRASKVVEVAKLMDPAYREFIGLNPEFAERHDPASAAALKGVPLENPVLAQRYRELRDEL